MLRMESMKSIACAAPDQVLRSEVSRPKLTYRFPDLRALRWSPVIQSQNS